MTEPAALDDAVVSSGDAVRWLYDEGVSRLAALGTSTANPGAAYTVEVATGMVTMYPATNGGIGADSTTLPADDLPAPTEAPHRLVVVGLTTIDSILVVDLSVSLMVAINAERPEVIARSWATQLLLHPGVNLTTNSSDIAIEATSRCRHSFIPGGGGTILSVDDGNPPVTTVALNATMETSDHLDLADDGTAEMYLGPRFWQLTHVMAIADEPWEKLLTTLEGSGE